MTIVYIALTVPVSVHMLRDHFETIPISIEEAATIDGCNRYKMLRHVTLPLSTPGDHVNWAVHLHDRLERIPVRAAVPYRGPRQVDGVARVCPS